MRDQTWRTVTNSALIFLGVVGLEVYRVPNAIMIPAYCGLILLAYYGRLVAVHHLWRCIIGGYKKKRRWSS
jgi:hypothetical protein